MPPPDDLLSLAVAAISNARDLLMDAQRLLDAGSAPRAHALATLAFEEAGKSMICTLCLFPPRSEQPEVFWTAFGGNNAHTRKLIRPLAFSLLLRETTTIQPLIERLDRAAEAAHRRKLRGLYVGYKRGRDGCSVTP